MWTYIYHLLPSGAGGKPRVWPQPACPWWFRWSRIHPQCRKSKFNPWVRKIPWRRAWQPTPLFLPEESHGQMSLAGYSPLGHKVRHDRNNLTCFYNREGMSTTLLRRTMWEESFMPLSSYLLAPRLGGKSDIWQMSDSTFSVPPPLLLSFHFPMQDT